jgi:hypothetical protein
MSKPELIVLLEDQRKLEADVSLGKILVSDNVFGH